ncbi:hypothetical protein Ddc_17560 [Ditylenchus destructor]|nr:hypothetical protein Ddc_17560 [Ditylenchus destructor]
MRRSTEKQTKFENEAQVEPSAQKNRLDKRITSIVTLDNDTTVEVFKYLKYCGLAKTSLVSKRFGDLISTHRHTLALLDVHSIDMTEDTRCPTAIQIFDKTLTPNEYKEWVSRNGYSKQIPIEGQSEGMQSTQYERKVYRLSAYADYKDSKPSYFPTKVFDASVELDHENWPVFQHFFRLLTDPFVHICSIRLPQQSDALNLLGGAINPNYGCLQCCRLDFSFNDDMQDSISWIKGHVRCDQFCIKTRSDYLPSNDEVFFDLFMTGANFTSEIELNFYENCNLIARFVQKFMDLKSCDGNKVVGTIACLPGANVNIDVFKGDYADFVVEGNINETYSNLHFEFVNNDIGKKLKLEIGFDYWTYVTLKTANL